MVVQIITTVGLFFVAGLLWAALWQMNKHNKT
jgi:hypothetical protein